jgi:predicted dehydrogenase
MTVYFARIPNEGAMKAPAVPIAIVGFGSIARSHLSALRALPATRPLEVRPVVVLVVSERADAIRDEVGALGIPQVVTSVGEALQVSELRLVDICSRNDRHAEQAHMALEAGRSVYVEKPIGRTADEADALAAAASAGPPAQPGLVVRYAPMLVEVRALLRAGAIGELRHGRLGSFHGSYLDPARPMSWRLRSAIAGGGAMLDLGVHLIDAIRFLAGELTIRAASAKTLVGRRPSDDAGESVVDVDDWSWAELGTPGGASVTVEASRVSLGSEGMPFELYGAEGSIVGDLGAGTYVLRRFDGGEASFRREVSADPLVRAVDVLRPPARLSLGSFVDLHAAALHHAALRAVNRDPAPGLAPTVADAAIAERLAHDIVRIGFAEPAVAGAARS